jgi:hypothetical protein
MHVCTTLRSAVTPLREKNTKNKKTKKYQKKKVTKSLYFTYAWGRPYPTDCNGSLHIGLGHQRNQSCKFLWLQIEGFGFCEGSNIGFSHRKLTWPLQHCLALPRWHVKCQKKFHLQGTIPQKWGNFPENRQFPA